MCNYNTIYMIRSTKDLCVNYEHTFEHYLDIDNKLVLLTFRNSVCHLNSMVTFQYS